MADKLFVIAIGGTGMRCLESFVHLCASGLYDNDTIEILTLDTDLSNGNKGRVERLIHLYNRVKTNDIETIGGEPRTNTFFSAKLNLYRFAADYSSAERRTLAQLARQTKGTAEEREDNQDLLDLMFDRDTVQDFQLDHGYRAQTHLGSLLMYHSIVEAARRASKGSADISESERDLKKFLEILQKNSENSRVFVFGSIFGGTGASSIPVIPLALKDAIKILSMGKNELNLDKTKFGSTLLTDYFTFATPNESQLKKEKVIADSKNFALNSQAALKFYYGDPTVKNAYKKLYHIGWPTTKKADFSRKDDSGNIITGGKEQENDCHIAELLCATAAFDFFIADDLNSNSEAKYLYRTVENSDSDILKLTGASFIGSEYGEMFENKLGALLSTAYIILTQYKGASETECGTQILLDKLPAQGIDYYKDLTPEQAKEIDEYMKEFAFKFVKARFIPGWIFQIKNSSNATFLFRSQAFPTTVSGALNVDPGDIFEDETHNWVKSGLFSKKSPEKSFDELYKKIKDPKSTPSEEQGSSVKERFLAHLYNAITMAQNYQF